MEWISVEDRLPEIMAPYLIAYKFRFEDEIGEESGFLSGFAWWEFGRWDDLPAYATEVTHWQPLPEPPTA